ncbi:MAG: hypothetical protein RR314_01310 [Oscillospiraceae bacterium]
MLNHICLHEGGHGHEGCCGHHDDGGSCCHSHDHSHEEALSPEQTLALMGYTLDHNRSHSEELLGISSSLAAQGNAEAARLVAEAVHYFDHCNEKLDEALKLVKGE